MSVISTANEIRSQWKHPKDVFSLLLLIGGNVIQGAVARVVGMQAISLGTSRYISLTPVAFSFGWIAYAFSSLQSVVGNRKLMPEPDTSIKVINCENGYVRENNSWVLGRLLRDKEHRVRDVGSLNINSLPNDTTGEVSLMIDIFFSGHNAQGSDKPRIFYIVWFSWCVIIIQQVIAAIPWIIFRDWSIFLITICGTALSLITTSIPQWTAEKWPGKRLQPGQRKTLALTRGNGHQYVMIVVCEEGSWYFEAMGSSRLRIFPETPLVLLSTTVLWVVLLITVTGLEENSWFLIAVGGIGMLQNLILSAVPAKPNEYDINLGEPDSTTSTITGYRYKRENKKILLKGFWKQYTAQDADQEYNNLNPPSQVRDVMGALMELEKHYNKAGAALLPIFFPGDVDYQPEINMTNREKEFWKFADRG